MKFLITSDWHIRSTVPSCLDITQEQWMELQMRLCPCICMDEFGCLRERCIQIHTYTSKLENSKFSVILGNPYLPIKNRAF